MLDLWLIRHGESKWNAEKRTQGQHPSEENDLTDLGMKQANALKKKLELSSFTKIYSSDLPRAVQTAQVCFPKKEIIQDARLREIKRGTLAGKTHEERTAEERELLAFIKQDRYTNRPPNGENHKDVIERYEAWSSGLAKEGCVAVFTHGGVIRAALALLLSYQKARYFDLDNTGITRLHIRENKTTIACVNDHSHLGSLNG